MVKAAREAKRGTSWLAPDDAYEAALKRLRDERTLADDAIREEPRRARSGDRDVWRVERARAGAAEDRVAGRSGHVSRKRDVGLAARRPGQSHAGRLRRPARAPRSDEERVAERARGVLPRRADQAGRRRARASRRGANDPELFLDGDYEPIDAGEEIVAFARTHATGRAVCAVTRFPWHATGGGKAPWAIGAVWGDRMVSIPPARWVDALTGAAVASDTHGVQASKLFGDLPVALLVENG